jgi:hypothetical protein
MRLSSGAQSTIVRARSLQESVEASPRTIPGCQGKGHFHPDYQDLYTQKDITDDLEALFLARPIQAASQKKVGRRCADAQIL